MGANRLKQLPGTRRRILVTLKKSGPLTIADLANMLRVSGEAVRQQLLQLQNDGWVRSLAEQGEEPRKAGRPATRYVLSHAGDHLFPKSYDGLLVEILNAIEAELGQERLNGILMALAREKVRRWQPRMAGLSLEERVELLRSIYYEEDPYMEIEHTEDGDVYRLIERNCPYLNIALVRPAICSMTVQSLSTLLDCHVKREEQIQSGDGRCTFRVRPDLPPLITEG